MSDSDGAVEGPDYARAPQPGSNRGGWRLHPRLLPTLAALVLAPAFVCLGNWQMNKARAKESLQTTLDARSHEPAVQMPAAPVTDAESLRYRRVSLAGRYEPERQFLLDNRVYKERAGYHVLTPLRLAGSEMRVLVNRGWVLAPADHSQHPEIVTPQEEVRVTGVAVVPGARFFTLAPEPPAAGQWRPVWQNLDLARYRDSVEFPVQPLVVLMDPDSAGGGFVREWPRPDERIERHLGYAWQWYGFAAALVAIWFAVNLRRT